MSIQNVKDIVENNGKTIEQNNMEKGHNIPLGTLVEVKYDKWHGDGACEKIHARLWVVDHSRDCDGTPLYSLCHVKINNIDDKFQVLLTDGDNGDQYALKDDISRKMVWNIHSGFAEDSLTIVEVTEDIESGKESLNW